MNQRRTCSCIHVSCMYEWMDADFMIKYRSIEIILIQYWLINIICNYWLVQHILAYIYIHQFFFLFRIFFCCIIKKNHEIYKRLIINLNQLNHLLKKKIFSANKLCNIVLFVFNNEGGITLLCSIKTFTVSNLIFLLSN